MKEQHLEDPDQLFEKGKIVEKPFSSTLPVFGPLIVWFRTMWNSVATKWYVRPMLDQQNEFNRLMVECVRDFESYAYELSALQDHDLTRLRHDVAALHLQVAQLNQRLSKLDEILDQKDAVAEEDVGQNGL